MSFDNRNYKKLEYIQSSGSQFINTGIIPSSDTAWTVKFAYSSFNDNYNRAFGVQSGVGSTLVLRSNSTTGGKYYFEDNGVGGVKTWGSVNIDFLPHTFVLNDNGSYTFDGTSMGDNWPAISDSLTQNFGLFRNSGVASGYAIGKLYACECKLNSTGATVQKLTPAQSRSTDEVGMYDEVTGTFFTNAGTGVFIAGPELKWEVTKSVIGYKPTTDISGLSTQASSPTLSSPVAITNVGPYELAGLYTGGEVDLGTLTWSYNSQYSYFRATPPNKLVNSINGYNETYGSLILYNSWGNIENGKIGIKADGSADVAIKDTRYTDPVAFQAAMSGKILYYQTSSQSSWIKPYFDKYYADGGIDETRYVGGKIDLGSLNWLYNNNPGGTPFFYINLSTIGMASNSINCFAKGYTTLSSFWGTAGNDKCMASGGSNFNISDFRFTDAAAFKEAMSGKYLYYQRTSDSSWTQPTVVSSRTIVRQIGKHTFNGTEAVVYDGGRYYYRPFDLLNVGATRNTSAMSNYFYQSTVNATGIIFQFNAEIYMYPDMTVCPNATAFKAWLAEKYNSGNPVEVYYLKNTATTESAPLVDVTSYKSIINYKPTSNLVGNTTQDGTPTLVPLANYKSIISI